MSPDGAYTATLFYRDGLTFGYQHVTLDAKGWHLFDRHEDAVEVASEGLQKVSWQGNRTLVIDYDDTKHKDNLEDIYFVIQKRRWHDVQILYRDVEATIPKN